MICHEQIYFKVVNPASNEPVLPVEALLYFGDIVKIGRFDCPANHPCFATTQPLHNNLFVLTHQPLWWRRGEGEFRFAERGAALLHRQGRQVERRDACPAGDVTNWFAIRQDVFEETLERNQLQHQHVTERTVSWLTIPRLRLREAKLLKELKRASLPRLEIEETVLCMFDRVCRGLSSHPPSRPASSQTRIRRQRLVDRTRLLLDSMEHDVVELKNNPSLSEIANQVGSSVFHLCRVFRAECGMSLHAYRQRQKLGRAIKLMQSSRQDLTELALNLGFSSHSHFTRVFRRHLGEVPSRFNLAWNQSQSDFLT
jgi:AraC family transcriptional regulator